MPKVAKSAVSPEVAIESANLAKRVKQPSQTKEQTKLIEQGIRKGLASYKQQQKAQAREQDKLRKKQLRAKHNEQNDEGQLLGESDANRTAMAVWLPWVLLVTSWLGFVGYLVL